MAGVLVLYGQTSYTARQQSKSDQILIPGSEKINFKCEIYIFWWWKQYGNIKKWLKFAIQIDFSNLIWLF